MGHAFWVRIRRRNRCERVPARSDSPSHEYRSLLNSYESTSMPEDDRIERIPINELHQEDGAHELATSEQMQPYLRLIMAEMQGADPTPELERLRLVALENRYIWR